MAAFQVTTEAFDDSAWTTDKDLDKMIKEATPESQTLYFIKQTAEFISSHQDKPKLDHYLDIHVLPKGWLQTMKAVR
jgi:hypothetical protein